MVRFFIAAIKGIAGHQSQPKPPRRRYTKEEIQKASDEAWAALANVRISFTTTIDTSEDDSLNRTIAYLTALQRMAQESQKG